MDKCWWRKVGEEWVVIGPVEQIAVGKVRVYKHSGPPKVVEFARMSPPFTERNTTVAYGYLK